MLTSLALLAGLCLSPEPGQEPAPAPSLFVGDPAPPFRVERFLRGEPCTSLAKGRVYVIEFWTAWCGPCLAGMPHLDALQRELGPRGLTVIGVAPRPDAWGHDLPAIEALLKRKSAHTYALALDAESDDPEGYQGVFHGRTLEAWMGAARVGAVPSAFVVDREGRLAAIAPPLEIEGVVRACLDGTFERDKAAGAYRELLAARAQLVELGVQLAAGERELARALSEELLDGPLWNDARYLGSLAGSWYDAGASGAELSLALRAAQRADALSHSLDPGVLGLLARLWLLDGQREAAARAQAQAVALAEGGLRAALEKDYAAVLARLAPAAAPGDVAGALLAAFERAPLVGLAEHHRRAEVHDFLLALVDHPRFGALVDDVVVEFGNARHQALVDRWLAGAEVPRDELAHVWRDTTQWLVWDSPLYERFFERVRARNLARPPEERVRVLLGDPPIRWEDVHGAKDYRAFAERDAHFAEVVEREVLAKGRRALLVTGSAHLQRRGPKGVTLPGGKSAAAWLEERHPGALFVAWTLPADAAQARELGFEHAPALRMLAGDALAEESFALLAPKGLQIQVAGKWQPLGELPWPPLGEMVDALLFVGAADTQVEPEPALYREASYQAELRRRAPILREVYGMDFLPELEGLLAATR